MIPEDLLYTSSHEWVKQEEGLIVTGLTDFAQQQLGDITFVELPEIGVMLEQGQEMSVVESVKAASEIYAPVSGEVVEVNDGLENAPEMINEDPFGKGWIVKIKPAGDIDHLLSPKQYSELTADG
ncbi:glycine cleavage system protein GcvH [Desulfonatronovibrio magnus]|uniref:glycine cleavage system protein GcvH n=1 Tax=Desulfonatronovibrio magnus TaxID=698827 RepID=UPI000AF93398|nr:glycine cleavage system protein GcvH [Desulfonatronovibrio magnus]